MRAMHQRLGSQGVSDIRYLGRVVLDRVREGVVDPVGKTRRTSRGAEEEVGHLRVQVWEVLRFFGLGGGKVVQVCFVFACAGCGSAA